jgi:flagellar motor switch protein FliG
MEIDQLSGMQKAGVLMIALGKEASAEMFRYMDEDDIESITKEIAKLGPISPKIREEIVEEFYQMVLAQEYVSTGGADYAEEILEDALGHHKATEILSRVKTTEVVSGFEVLENVELAQVITVIQHEHPQTIALMLANMAQSNAERAGNIMALLPEEKQADIAQRIAKMESISTDVLQDVQNTLNEQMKSFFSKAGAKPGGAKSVAEVLKYVDRGTEKNILGTLEKEDPELANDIKALMFVFEDIVKLDDRELQKVLQKVETKDLSLALKVASDDVKEKVYSNMSERAATQIKEDIEFMGKIRVKDVEEDQKRVVDLVSEMETEGEIVISRGAEEFV